MTTIVHTTDSSNDDHLAFAHAIALARAAGADLVSLRANAPDSDTTRIPSAADVLTRWGDSPTSVAFTPQVHNCCDDAIETILDALDRIQPKLVVAASHERSALVRFFAGSGAEAIAHNVEVPVLLMPAEARGFVAESDGRIELSRVLIPIGDAEAAAVAVRSAAWLAELAGLERADFVLLHVGQPVAVAENALTARPGWTVLHRHLDDGSIEAAIVEHAEDAGLIVMATRGHDSVGDVLRGSVTDRVLHRAHRPILSVSV